MIFLWLIGAYLVFLIGVSVYKSRSIEDQDDFIIYPAATVSILALVVVSLATPPSPEEKWRPFQPRPSAD